MGVKRGRGRQKQEASEEPPEAAKLLAEIAALEKKLEPWRVLKEQLAEARRKLKALGAALAERLTEARVGLSGKDCRQLVLALARDELEVVLRQYMAEHLQEIIGILANLWDKYAVSLAAIEAERTTAVNQSHEFFEELGYA